MTRMETITTAIAAAIWSNPSSTDALRTVDTHDMAIEDLVAKVAVKSAVALIKEMERSGY